MSGQPLLVGPVIHLGTLEPFHTLSHAQLAAIALEADEVVYQEESWLVRPGDPVRAMHVLVDGFAHVVGEDRPHRLGPGATVGFPDLLVPRPSRTGTRADTDIVALSIDMDSLRTLCEHDFAILAALLTHLAERATQDPRAAARIVAGSDRPWAPLPEGRLDRVRRMLALHRVPAFPAHSMDALAELAGHVSQLTAAEDQDLWAAGRRADGFWIVCSGSIEVTGPERSTVTVGPGGLVGFVETLAGQRYVGRARARAPATVLAVGVDPFFDVLEDHFELGFSLLAYLAAHLVEDEAP